MPGPTRPPIEAEATTRERILAAALDVFAERGFDGARVREIAERAEANLGLLTYYFTDKEQLWQAAVDSAFAELAAELGAVLATDGGDDDVAELERIVRHFVRFVARRPAFMQLMNDEGKRDGPRMRWLADTYVRPLWEAIRGRIERAQARGVLPPLAPVHLYYIVLGAAGLIFSQGPECRRIAGIDATDPAFAEAHADAILRLLLPAGAARRSPRR
ncbi:TetR/AcrR family transcriptional regulator [bacterium]|nr:TetR/AcrR family transcriptional regulator [bacterium]